MTKNKSVAKKPSREKELVRIGFPPNVRSGNEKGQRGSSKETLRLGIPPDIRVATPQNLKAGKEKNEPADEPRKIKRASKATENLSQTSK